MFQWAGDEDGPDWGDLKHNEKEPELVLKKVKDVSFFLNTNLSNLSLLRHGIHSSIFQCLTLHKNDFHSPIF